MPGKDPQKVAAGQARQRQLRATLGDRGYRALQARNAQAANAAQLLAWGSEGYRQQRRDAYAALVEQIGEDAARQRIERATEAHRQHRLAHPSPGERLLRAALTAHGFDVRLAREPFDYTEYRRAPAADITEATAIVEAHVGRYCCDVLLPARRIAIEVYGGAHVLQSDYDAAREGFLRAQGLALIILREGTDTPLGRDQVESALAQHLLA